METSLTVKNIVLLGEFQPSKFDKYYFLKNNIFEEYEISEESLFTSDFTIVIARGFNLTIVANQLVLNEIEPKTDDAISELMSKIVSTCAFIGTGFGINLHWYLFSGDKTSEVAKKYFYNEKSVLNTFFNEENVSYGSYISKDFGNSRLKLDIKPATVVTIDSEIEQRIISFGFNFHTDLKGDDFKADIFKSLSEFKDYINETFKIISLYE
jgi:hypothetical protein